MAEDFDFGRFTEDLVKGITREIGKKRDEFSKEQLQCLAIDIHPWSGFLNLCMRVKGDKQDVPWVSDWKYTNSACGVSEESQPEWAALAGRMEAAYLSIEESSGQEPEKCAEPFFRACAVALKDSRVTEVLSGFKASGEVQRFVSNPDDGDNKNFCDVN